MIDLRELHFGRLAVIKEAETVKGKRRWVCACICGTQLTVDQYKLRSGATQSCGCLRNELTAKRSTVHGHARRGYKSRTWSAWAAMNDRCYRKSSTAYQRYGAVGIQVCDRWRTSYDNFLADMGECPEGMTLDRRDNSLGYELNNCRWSTPSEQAVNRRTTRLVTIGDRTQCLKHWASEFGIDYIKVYKRVTYLGWTIEEALEINTKDSA